MAIPRPPSETVTFLGFLRGPPAPPTRWTGPLSIFDADRYVPSHPHPSGMLVIIRSISSISPSWPFRTLSSALG
jgi:hypothetical protein